VTGGLTWFALGAVLFVIAPFQSERFFKIFDGPLGGIVDAMLTLVVAIPGNALMIGLTGVSIGKWLCGVKVVRPDGRPIGVVAAFGREVRVWFQGFGMGAPLVSLFTLIGSFSKLNEEGRSPWDPPRQRVALHRPMNGLQIFLMIVAVALLIAVRVGIQLLSKTS